MIKEFRGKYNWLSNFYPVKIIINGIEYASIEHAYMSEKSSDIEWKNYCFNNSASDVKRKSKTILVRDDWDDIKLNVMQDCLTQKFNQEPFKSMLLGTKKEQIIEGNTWNDKFWGFCLKTNEGENNLGRLIMEIRYKLSINE